MDIFWNYTLHIVILNHDWLKDKSKFSKTMISCKIMMKSLCGSFERQKNGFKEDLPALPLLGIVFSEL